MPISSAFNNAHLCLVCTRFTLVLFHVREASMEVQRGPGGPRGCKRVGQGGPGGPPGNVLARLSRYLADPEPYIRHPVQNRLGPPTQIGRDTGASVLISGAKASWAAQLPSRGPSSDCILPRSHRDILLTSGAKASLAAQVPTRGTSSDCTLPRCHEGICANLRGQGFLGGTNAHKGN